MAFAICQSNLCNACSSLPSVKYYVIKRAVTYAEESCHAATSTSSFSTFVGLASDSRFFILSELVFTFMAAFGIAWFNNSTLLV